MPDVVIRSEIPSKSGLVRDKFTNTFSFTGVPDLGNATLDALIDAVADFYRAIPTGALVPLADLFSSEITENANAWLIKAYDATGHLAGTTSMGAPVRQAAITWETTTAGNNGLPAEVAVCVTLETGTRAEEPVETTDSGDAGVERDRPMQRHTGRVYLGPLAVECLAHVNGQVRPAATILDTARLAVAELQSQAFINAGGSDLAVWSRKDAVMRPVEFVSVDNSFDIIRSRGPAPTIRERDGV